jgi:alginate O-acetyltransferase complex protein AlgI
MPLEAEQLHGFHQSLTYWLLVGWPAQPVILEPASMLLTTAAYFSFLAVVFFAFWLAARYRLGALAVVLFANYFFYARWDLAYLAIIPAASTCDFLIGNALARYSHPGLRRLLITLSILLNIGLIASVKYLPVLSWVLPLALSSY